MKKGLVLSLFLVMSLLVIYKANAQDYKTALGIRISSNDAIVNNSISLKYFLNSTTVLEGLLSFGDPLALGLLVEKHRSLSLPGLNWFYGAGGYIGFGDRKNIGAQGVLGLDYKIANLPLNLSVDWKPELNLAKDFTFEPAAVGVSFRFTF
jgi:hypothetical protein